MEYEVNWFLLGVVFLLNVLLTIQQNVWTQFNITWFVYPVYITKSCGYSKQITYLA